MTERQKLVERVAGHVHAGQMQDGAWEILKLTGAKKKPDSKDAAVEAVTTLFHWCLDQDDYFSAAKILWPTTLFDPRPECTQRIWKAIQENALVMLLGASSMSKTFSAGVWTYLDWIKDCEYTSCKLLGPSELHLQSNLASHLFTLHSSASLPMPGRLGDLFIGVSLRNRRASISGVVIPARKSGGAGRLQGTKRWPRKTPHPRFGPLSRLRVLCDEAEKITASLWPDLDNLTSNVDGAHGLKIICCFNPQDISSPVAARCEPEKGWAEIDPDKDYEWTSKKGWKVVRLDAARCENVVQKRTVFPGLQTVEGLKLLEQAGGGQHSPSYLCFGRAIYATDAQSIAIISPPLMARMWGRPIWQDSATPAAGVDIALEGKASCTFSLGHYGWATGIRYKPTPEHPQGRIEMFTTNGQPVPRRCLELTQIFTLPPADTVAMAKEIKRVAQRAGVQPSWTCLDRTGNGAGVHDLLLEIWSPEVRGINTSESASEFRILQEDTETAKEAYDRAQSELLFALRGWAEVDAFKINPEIPADPISEQFTTRQFEDGRRKKVESKPNYRSRGFSSPDECDSATLLVHAVRLASGHIPSRRVDTILPDERPWHEDSASEPLIGVTDRHDDLDSEYAHLFNDYGID